MTVLRLVKSLAAAGWLAAAAVPDAPLLAQNMAPGDMPSLVERKEPVIPRLRLPQGDFIVLVKATIGADGSVVSAAPDGHYAPGVRWMVTIAVETVKSYRFQPSAGRDTTTMVGINFARPEGWEPVDEFVTIGEWASPPKTLFAAVATYPGNVRVPAGQPGVAVAVTIDASGIPVDAVALEPLNELAGPALDAALRSRFEPDATVPRRRMAVKVPFVVATSFGPPRSGWPNARVVDGRSDSGVVPARVVRQVKPFYTAEAMKKKQQGTVIVEALVGTDGSVLAGRITRSLPLLDRSALDCVRQWKFTPMLVDGQPTPTVITVDLQFTLK